MGLLPKKGLAALIKPPVKDTDEPDSTDTVAPELALPRLYLADIMLRVRARQRTEEMSPVIDPTTVVSSNGKKDDL